MNWMIGTRRSDAVIIGVIAAFFVFAFLPFPPYGRPRRSIVAACLSELKQIALAQEMYAYDHDGLLPDATAWMDELIPYVKTQDIYHCPALRKTPDAYGYSMDFLVSGVNSRKLSRPESTPLVFESVLLVRNATSGFYGFPDPPRHGTANCVAFLDGHVNVVAPEQPAKIGGSEGAKR